MFHILASGYTTPLKSYFVNPLPPISPDFRDWKIFEKFPDPDTLYQNQNFRPPLPPHPLILGTWKIFKKFPPGSLLYHLMKKYVENVKEYVENLEKYVDILNFAPPPHVGSGTWKNSELELPPRFWN